MPPLDSEGWSNNKYMREIKYKVWCKDKNEWEKDKMVLLDDGLLMEVETGHIVNKETHPVVFSTGLKDKNGKEIYEGDLLQVANNHIYEVCFLTEDFETQEIICSFGLKNKFTNFAIDDYAIRNGKVIGNIFENHNLLTN